MTLVQNWVNQNVDGASKDATLVKVTSCFNALAMNIGESLFEIFIYFEIHRK